MSLLLFCDHVEGSQFIQTDVCVYGGGAGGVTAAVQVARMGKSVALLVFNNHLGGMTSSGLGETDIGVHGDAYIQGLAREFYTRIGAKYGATSAQFTFEPHVAEVVFDELAQQAGVSVYNNEQLATTTLSGTRIFQVTMVNGDVFQAKMFIDASYEGDLLKQAGVSYTVGRESTAQYGEGLAGIRKSGTIQPLPTHVDPYVTPGDSTSGLLPGINPDSGGVLGGADQKIQAYCYRMCLTNIPANRITISQPPGYNRSDYELLFRAIAAGQNNAFWNNNRMPNGKTDSNNASGMSTDFIGMNAAYPEADYATRAQIALAHKNWQLGLMWTLQNDPAIPQVIRTTWSQWGLAADEFTDNGNWPPQLYVREARRMISDYVMTQKNCFGTVVASDSVGLSAYTIDSHHAQRFVAGGFAQNEGCVENEIPGPYPISYRSIIPKTGQCSNLLVPWCVSASHIAFASIRLEPVYMILGQSAAAAACIAIDDNVAVQNVSYTKLKSQLIADGQALGNSSAVIVSNGDTCGVLQTGSWTLASTTYGYYGSNYLTDGNTDKGNKSVRFTPALPYAGNYRVYLNWSAYSDRATNVPVDIISSTGTSTVAVNQQQNGGQWIYLGTYPFDAGTSGSVLIRTTGTNGFVVANAVQFAPAEGRTFQDWRNANFTAAQLNDPGYSGDLADPAHDGLPNLLKAFFNRNPNTPDGFATSASDVVTIGTDSYLTLSYSRSDIADLVGTVQVTSDLSNPSAWVSGPAKVQLTVISDDGINQTVIARDFQPLGQGSRRFMRLSVTHQP